MHEVLVNRLGGLSLPRKSVVRLTDCPDMTLDVYCGRKTTIQPKKSNNLAILLATSDTTADQTAPSNQGLQDKLFCGFKQTQKKIQ